MNTFLKGLIMTLVVFFATTIKTQGFPATNVSWEVLAIITIGTIIGYVLQSLTIKSTSMVGTLNIIDFVKGLIIALVNFVSTWGAAAWTNTAINWGAFAAGAGSIVTSYLVKQFMTVPTGIPPTK